jgi:hypothetical protein
MMYIMRTSGAETLSATANVFMGQTEAPIIVKPYVPSMTQSELLALMVGGMSTISGGVMAVYITLWGRPGRDPDDERDGGAVRPVSGQDPVPRDGRAGDARRSASVAGRAASTPMPSMRRPRVRPTGPYLAHERGGHADRVPRVHRAVRLRAGRRPPAA